MNYRTEQVFIDNIDIANTSYKISAARDISDLEKSIKNIGLINFPILCANQDNFYIISGFHRIKACINIGLKKIFANIIDSDNKSAKYFKTAAAITDNSFARELNFVEIARAFNLLSALYEDKKLMLQKALEFNLPNSEEFFNKVIKINDMPAFLQNALIKETVALPVALELQQFKHNEPEIFIRLFEEIPFGLNRQRALILFLKEISIIEDIPITKLIIQDKEIKDIISDKEKDKKFKSKLLLELLTKRRYPALTDTKKRFEKNLKKLKLSDNISLIPPANFENTIYSLSVNFKNIEELKADIKKIDSIASDPILKKMINQP